MIVSNASFAKMAKDIVKNNKQIVVFGTGVIGSTIVPALLHEYHLTEMVQCYIDNDSALWKDEIDLGSKTVKVCSPTVLKECEVNTVLLLAMSRYDGAIQQLANMECTKQMTCCIVPQICIDLFGTTDVIGAIKTSRESIIPKTIHYMWLGDKPLSEGLLKCIESWKKYCPGYEIIRWDESNYDVHKNQFVSEAYDNGKFGFVPDFARLDLLYTYGGIYMDTDVELLKPLDDLLFQEAFCGVEKWQVLNFGACSGAVKGHKSLEPFIQRWEERKIIRSDGSLDKISSGLIDTSVALEHGYQINGNNQMINGMNIYTYDYFNPYDYMTKKVNKTENTYGVHWFNGGWI